MNIVEKTPINFENNSYYFDAAPAPKLIAPKGGNNYDVIIIGAGLTGVSAALNLAQSGIKVAVLEAHHIGFGASGRNGGLVCSGFRHDQSWFEAKMGYEFAKKIWAISEAAKLFLEENIAKYNINADYEKGLLFAAHTERQFDFLKNDSAILLAKYNYFHQEILNQEECSAALGTNVYKGGVLDKAAGRINPLKYLYGLAKVANLAGADFYENCRALKYEENSKNVIINTSIGDFTADQILLCGDGYLHGLNEKTEARVLPISSYVIATEPVPDDILKGAIGGMDTRFVVNYFHKTADNRLVFGGGEKYTPKPPKDIEKFVRKNLSAVFPKLKDIKITHAWGGALGISATRLPYVRQLSNKVMVSSGYSGQGVLLAPFFGDILGKTILAKESGFDIISQLPVPPFPGGRLLRAPALTLAMTYYSLLDKLP